MFALKLLAAIAVSALVVVVPVVLHDTFEPVRVVMSQTPDVDAHAMWSRWPR
ncbi:hypothetical protein [Janthinobacterium agaricidamnosum]|uniref:Uncharacterized protein n=1 Tax=Janthinobacterium agaricidamnosum NBRC 102515 = DSM 9628 TaxID=1349767 RepID=W0V8P5_9BURK|nr:hypothetical protein [Janthinobacterium agaricidamnosum]CDG83647.1 hypothetical protein GJA_3021 [Janthinobacterium agaricidamnosum NBRC 102515 = DSM 9628]